MTIARGEEKAAPSSNQYAPPASELPQAGYNPYYAQFQPQPGGTFVSGFPQQQQQPFYPNVQNPEFMYQPPPPFSPQFQPHQQQPPPTSTTASFHHQFPPSSSSSYVAPAAASGSTYLPTQDLPPAIPASANPKVCVRWTAAHYIAWLIGASICLAAAIVMGFLCYHFYSDLFSKPLPVFSAGQSARGIFAFGQMAVGVVAVGQLSVGIITIGQVSFGIINLGCMAGVGILYALGMAVASCGISIGIASVSSYVIASVVGVGFLGVNKVLIGISVMLPCFVRKWSPFVVNSGRRRRGC